MLQVVTPLVSDVSWQVRQLGFPARVQLVRHSLLLRYNLELAQLEQTNLPFWSKRQLVQYWMELAQSTQVLLAL